jgi:hypothetical protein
MGMCQSSSGAKTHGVTNRLYIYIHTYRYIYIHTYIHKHIYIYGHNGPWMTCRSQRMLLCAPGKNIHIYIYEFENRMSVGTNTSIFVKGWTSNRRNGHARCLTLPTPIRQGERWPGSSESLNSPLGYLFIGYLGMSDPPKICVFWQMIPRPRPCLVFVHFFWTIRCF